MSVDGSGECLLIGLRLLPAQIIHLIGLKMRLQNVSVSSKVFLSQRQGSIVPQDLFYFIFLQSSSAGKQDIPLVKCAYFL